MKTIKVTIALGLMLNLSSLSAQTNLPKDSTNNLLDMQATTYGNIFGEELTGQPEGKITGYLDLVDQSDLPAEQKLQLRAFYETYAAQLNEKGKDSLQIVLSKKLLQNKKKDTL